MANTTNSVSILGRLGGKPTFTKTKPGGHSLAKFSVATERYMGPGREPQTDWHNVVCWNAQADSVAEYLDKGDQVSIEGNLHQNQWTTPSGFRSRTEIYATKVLFLRKAGAPMAPAPATIEEPEPVAAD